jgi:hypothetical protein
MSLTLHQSFLARKVIQVLQALQELLVPLVLLALQEVLVPLEVLVLLVLPEPMAERSSWNLKKLNLSFFLARKVLKEFKVLLGLRARQVLLVLQVRKVVQDFQDSLRLKKLSHNG